MVEVYARLLGVDHYEETWNRARDIWDGELYFAEDGQVFEL